MGTRGPSWGHLWATLAPCWLHSCPDLAHLGTSGAQLETIAGPFLGSVGPLCRTVREACQLFSRASCPSSGLVSWLQPPPSLDAPSLGGGTRSAYDACHCCDGRGPDGCAALLKSTPGYRKAPVDIKKYPGGPPLGNFCYANKPETPIYLFV